jgi:hypothetical protein
MLNGENLSERQEKLEKLTIGKLKEIINKSELPDDAEIFADYPAGWSGIFQVYKQNGRLFMLASDNEDDSGIGGGTEELDTLLWRAEGLCK